MEKKLLLSVEKPARYVDNEINSIKKDLDKVDLKFALVFPDTYEIGMSNVGINLLYQLLNQRDDIACERAFSPWIDYEKALKENALPLTSLENGLPLNEFDIIGFSLQSELCHTNVLNILALSNIPLYRKERGENDPIILGGGPVAYNPEPVADFFDAFLIGDGEEALIEICDTVKGLKKSGMRKNGIIDKLTGINGVYVPSLFDVEYNDDGSVKKIIPLKEGYTKVMKRTVSDIDSSFYSSKQIVPFLRPVHDRLNMEIARGCVRGCRFCHAGYVYRPYRERSCERIQDYVKSGLKNTGYEEVSLLSLSAGDFSLISPLLKNIMSSLCHDRISVSLPSLRPGTIEESLLEEIKKVRKTGFTIAPEAGSERLRRIINKDISDDEILSTADMLFKLGWRKVKLYFMIGLPFETMDDVEAIVSLSKKVKGCAKKYNVNALVNVSVSNFVPKGHTPFQYVKQANEEELREKQIYLKNELKKSKLQFKWHDTRLSLLEGIFSRGDRRLSRVLKRAFELGARFDEWTDILDFSIWEAAFTDCNTDVPFYLRERDPDETFPYDHILTGVTKDYLKSEYELSKSGVPSPPCNESCKKCGICGGGINVIKNSMLTYKKETVKKRDEVIKKKLRFEYTKLDEASFIGHLDMQTMFIRALNRSGIKYAFSKGYHPMPKISFGSAISLGLNSISEYAEIDLIDNITGEEFIERMNENLPNGMRIKKAYEVSFKEKSLFNSISAVKYEVEIDSIKGLRKDVKIVREAIDNFNKSDEVILEKIKKGKVKRINSKEFVDSLSLDEDKKKLTAILKRSEKGELNIFNFLTVLFKIEKDDIINADILKTESVF